MKIIEIFHSIQGEPRSIGKSAIFIRFPFCTLKCIWCDTKYASNPKKTDYKEFSIEEVIKEIKKYPNTNLLIFTGGEPLLYQQDIVNILQKLNDEYEVEIETNGTIYPKLLLNFCINYNVSPKLASSGNLYKIRYQPDILKKLNKLHAIFKFVVKTKIDWKEVEKIVKQIKIPNEQIYIMPEGLNRTRWIHHALKLIDKIKNKGWNLATRLHIILWNKKRKV